MKTPKNTPYMAWYYYNIIGYILGLYGDYIGIMEKKMEITIVFRFLNLESAGCSPDQMLADAASHMAWERPEHAGPNGRTGYGHFSEN